MTLLSEDLRIRNEIEEKVIEYFNHRFKSNKFIPGKSKVHYAGRVFDEKEIINLVNSALDFWLTEGKYTRAFEKQFAEYFGLSDAILVNSGSSANLIAISTLTSPLLKERQLKPGDEVITVATGFPTTVYPIIQNRLIPVFVDADIGTYNANIGELKAAVTPKTKAIMIAHTMGNPFDLDEITKICRENNLWLIEDNCDALGSKYNENLTGTFGDMATFSFYPAHHITMGEGGCVVTNNKLLSTIARSIRDWGRDCYCAPGKSNTCGKRFDQQLGQLPTGYDHKYIYTHLGYNLKVTDMQAAVGLAQLEKLSSFIAKRKQNFDYLKKGLSKFSKFLILPEKTQNSDPSWFGMLLTVKENSNFDRKEIVKFLELNRIETRNLFAGNLTKQPVFENENIIIKSDLKNSDYIMYNTFFIGVYPGLEQEHLDYILSIFTEFFNEKIIENKKV